MNRWCPLALSLTTLCLLACGGSGDGHPTWSKTFGGEARDEALGVAASADGVLVAGAWELSRSGVSGDDGDLWVMALDDVGNLRWQQAIGQRNVIAPGQQPPSLRALAVPETGAWLAGTTAEGHALVARLDDEGGTMWTTEFTPHKPERFEQGWAVSPAGSGAVVAVWADDVVTESSSDGHPATPDVKSWLAPRWRVRVLTVDGDGGAGWGRTLPPLHTEREPQALAVVGFPDGGAAVALSLEATLEVTRIGPDGAILWTLERSGQDDALGLIALPDGDFVAYGNSVGLPGRRGFATRFGPSGDVTWHEHFGAVDTMTAGTLACPASGPCHLAFAGQDYGAIVPAFSDALRVDLDGHLLTETESVALGPAVAVGYDPTADRYAVTTHPWLLQLHTQALTGDLAKVGTERVVGQDGGGAGATGPDGRLLFLSHAPARLLAYPPGEGAQVYAVDLNGREGRRELGWAVLPLGGGALVTGASPDGGSWGVRINDSGGVQWQRRWAMGASQRHQLAPGADGGFWMAGDSVLGQFAADGTALAAVGLTAAAPALAAWAEGGVLVAGRDWLGGWSSSFALSFSKSYASGSEWLRLHDVAALGEGAVAVGRLGTDGELLLLRVDANGEPLGATRIAFATGETRGAVSVDVVDGRPVLAATWLGGDAGEDVLLVGLDATGGLAWTRRYGGLLDDRASDIAASPLGGLAIGGATSTASVDFDAWVLRLDREGLVDGSGTCQALLDAPSLTVTPVEVSASDRGVGSRGWQPASSVTSATAVTPELLVARQCVGQASTPQPDADAGPLPDAGPDAEPDADPDPDVGPDTPAPPGFGIQASVGGVNFDEGQPVPRYSTVTLTAVVPGDLSDYTYQWFRGPAEDPSDLGTDPEIQWQMEAPELFRLVISQDGVVVAELERTIDIVVSQVFADLLVCPSPKPYAGAAIQLRARTSLDNMTVFLTDHPEVASLDWTIDPYILTPEGVDAGPPLTHSSTDSLWTLDPGTLTAGAWYEAFVRAKDAAGNELAISNPSRFEVSSTPQVTICGPPP